ncbi:unnamed protein product [Prunus armeniaca]
MGVVRHSLVHRVGKLEVTSTRGSWVPGHFVGSPGLGSVELSIGRGHGLEALAREPWGAKFEKQGARPMEYI